MLSISCKNRVKGYWRGLLLSTAALTLLSVSQSYADSPSVTGINTPGGIYIYSTPFGISGDGGVLVGGAEMANYQSSAFRWTAAGGMVILDTLPGGANANAYAVSSDGSILVGYSDGAGTGGSVHATKWAGGAVTDLGTFAGGTNSYAFNISGDGGIVVGASNDGSGNTFAFRWTAAGGMVSLGALPGGASSAAHGISGDGNVIVGTSNDGSGNTFAFRWTAADGMVSLGALPGGMLSFAAAVSRDGGTVVGYSKGTAIGSNIHAVVWTGGAITDLGTLGGYDTSFAYAVSANGGVIVGESFNSPGAETGHAFRWTAQGGMQDLNTLLTRVGVDMTGITLVSAEAVSDSGQYIAASTSTAGYLVVLEPWAGLTTAASQQAATRELAHQQHASMVGSRIIANELLGLTRPISDDSYIYGGGMTSDAEGYAGGQYSRRNVTLLGGVSYGQPESSGFAQSNSAMLALAGRYMFHNGESALNPFGEVGGWVTTNHTLRLSRSYANGAGTATASGDSTASSWDIYGRFGLAWKPTPHDNLAGWAELGRQTMNYGGYSEIPGASNPFPVSVNSGDLHFTVARLGAALTHEMVAVPLTVTVSGAIARSFNTQSLLQVDVAGIGMTEASVGNSSWGEFGARMNTHITQRLSAGVGLLGVTGGMGLGTRVRGTAGLTYML